jgi:putative tricarboxylic transport membrane protein
MPFTLEFFSHLQLGFSLVFTGGQGWWAFGGCLFGFLGSLAVPTLGPAAFMALLLPLVLVLDAPSTLMLLAGIYCGAQPQGAPAGATDTDALVSQGRAREARVLASSSAAWAGCAGWVVVASVAPLGSVWLHTLEAGEYFSLLVLGLAAGVAFLASGSLLKGLAMTTLGMLLAQFSAKTLSNLTSQGLADVHPNTVFVALAMGLLGVGGLLSRPNRRALPRPHTAPHLQASWPTWQELKDTGPAVVRGSLWGVMLGALDGAGVRQAAQTAYQAEKKIKLSPNEPPFGRGNVRGVASAESAHHAATQTSLIPLLALGIPHNAAMALLAGAWALKGLETGSQQVVLASHTSLFWGLMATLAVSQALRVALRWLPCSVPKVLSVPRRPWVLPILVLWSCLSMQALDSHWGIYLVTFFTAAGYLLHKLGCKPAPLLLGFVMGPALEAQLQAALQTTGGNWSAFITLPLSAGLLVTAVLLLVVVAARPSARHRRAERPAND